MAVSAARGGDGRLPGRTAAALAAPCAAVAVGLGAYAAHAAEPVDGERLRLASQYLLFHSLAVLALLGCSGQLLAAARWGLLLGMTLFGGSLAAAALADLPSTLAPVGGLLLMLSWLLLGVALWRGEGRRG